MMDVSGLVAQMNDTLAAIHTTIGGLSTAEHDAKLDELEQKRDVTLAALRAGFEQESDDLVVQRRRERDQIAERRRKEDEEIAARRKKEDEELSSRCSSEDNERQDKFSNVTRSVEDEIDGLMESVEATAQEMIEEGRKRLSQLEDKRRELNRLIDEQLSLPLPTAPSRKKTRSSPAVSAITSKPTVPPAVIGDSVGNSVKATDGHPVAHEEAAPRDPMPAPVEETVAQDVRGAPKQEKCGEPAELPEAKEIKGSESQAQAILVAERSIDEEDHYEAEDEVSSQDAVEQIQDALDTNHEMPVNELETEAKQNRAPEEVLSAKEHNSTLVQQHPELQHSSPASEKLGLEIAVGANMHHISQPLTDQEPGIIPAKDHIDEGRTSAGDDKESSTVMQQTEEKDESDQDVAVNLKEPNTCHEAAHDTEANVDGRFHDHGPELKEATEHNHQPVALQKRDQLLPRDVTNLPETGKLNRNSQRGHEDKTPKMLGRFKAWWERHVPEEQLTDDLQPPQEDFEKVDVVHVHSPTHHHHTIGGVVGLGMPTPRVDPMAYEDHISLSVHGDIPTGELPKRDAAHVEQEAQGRRLETHEEQALTSEEAVPSDDDVKEPNHVPTLLQSLEKEEPPHRGAVVVETNLRGTETERHVYLTPEAREPSAGQVVREKGNDIQLEPVLDEARSAGMDAPRVFVKPGDELPPSSEDNRLHQSDSYVVPQVEVSGRDEHMSSMDDEGTSRHEGRCLEHHDRSQAPSDEPLEVATIPTHESVQVEDLKQAATIEEPYQPTHSFLSDAAEHIQAEATTNGDKIGIAKPKEEDERDDRTNATDVVSVAEESAIAAGSLEVHIIESIRLNKIGLEPPVREMNELGAPQDLKLAHNADTDEGHVTGAENEHCDSSYPVNAGSPPGKERPMMPDAHITENIVPAASGESQPVKELEQPDKTSEESSNENDQDSILPANHDSTRSDTHHTSTDIPVEREERLSWDNGHGHYQGRHSDHVSVPTVPVPESCDQSRTEGLVSAKDGMDHQSDTSTTMASHMAEESTVDTDSQPLATSAQTTGNSGPHFDNRDNFHQQDDHIHFQEEQYQSAEHTLQSVDSGHPSPLDTVTIQGYEDLFDDDYDSVEGEDEGDTEENTTVIDSQERLQMETPDTEPSMSAQVIEYTPSQRDESPKTAVLTPNEPAGVHQDISEHQSHHDDTCHVSEPPLAEDDVPLEKSAQNIQKTPRLATHDGSSSDVSPLSLRKLTPITPSRGLAFSRWNSYRPSTPPSHQLVEEDFSPESFVPRDVTNLPWHERNDSTPASVHSRSTLSSSPPSPFHSSSLVDGHEPVIRDSWHGPMSTANRPRGNSHLTDRVIGDDYDPFKFDSGVKTVHNRQVIISTNLPGQSQRNSTSSSPSSLFQKMRSIFENPQLPEPQPSPVRSHPVSGVFHQVKPVRSTRAVESPRKGGFLNEHEDEIDEHSALLNSNSSGLRAI